MRNDKPRDSAWSWVLGMLVMVGVIVTIAASVSIHVEMPLFVLLVLFGSVVANTMLIKANRRQAAEIHAHTVKAFAKESRSEGALRRGIREEMARKGLDYGAVPRNAWQNAGRQGFDSRGNELISVSALRIGHKERELVLTELGDHYAEGRITADEFEERSTAVSECKTAAELVELVKDLPGVQAR